MWKTLNELTCRSSKSGTIPTCIESDEVIHTNPTSVAKILNEYFTTIGLKLANQIKIIFNPLITRVTPLTNSSFSFVSIDEGTVHKYLRSLKTKKAIGLDHICARLLKDSANVTIPCLTRLFNKSLFASKFPTVWKKGKVVPIFKSGNRSDKSNYRPITILPVLSKVFEKAVHSQLYNYIQTNNLLSANQFGFRPGRSTDVALTQLTENILDRLDNGLVTGAVFLDLKKAFDTVNHELSLSKLKSVGLDTTAAEWFESYLCNREQVVSVNNCFFRF